MPIESRQAKVPTRIVAISGVIFSVLYIASLVLIRCTIPANPKEPGAWHTDPVSRSWGRIALNLVPFAGVAFFWFMAVLRNCIGLFEDKLFATVFLGSGLLLVTMLFATAAFPAGELRHALKRQTPWFRAAWQLAF